MNIFHRRATRSSGKRAIYGWTLSGIAWKAAAMTETGLPKKNRQVSKSIPRLSHTADLNLMSSSSRARSSSGTVPLSDKMHILRMKFTGKLSSYFSMSSDRRLECGIKSSLIRRSERNRSSIALVSQHFRSLHSSGLFSYMEQELKASSRKLHFP